MLRFLCLAAGLTVSIAAPAVACDLSADELRLSLIGNWTVNNGFGTLSFNGQTMPLPAGKGTTAQVVPTENGLAVTGGIAPGTYDMTFVETSNFVLDAPSQTILDQGEAWFGEAPSIITNDELALLTGCKEGQMLPQIQISGSFQDPEGTVEFDVYLFALSETTLYGISSGRLLSMGGQAKRVTRWTR